jgi:CRISPR-associated endonuclease/helicase Cas3
VISSVTLEYFAHSDPDGRPQGNPAARWQPLAVHLHEVAGLAESFAREAGASEALTRRARALGLLHDVGKYRTEFQRLLRGEIKKAPHSAYGAALAWLQGQAPDAAFAIAGHHAGMPDPVPLRERLAKVRPELADLVETAIRDCPEIEDCLRAGGLLGRADGGHLQIECATRILFSCLIDADRLDTARHGGSEIGLTERLDASKRLQLVLKTLAEKADQVAEGPVKAARGAVLEACLTAATRRGPLFSLTVPTGGGKTLASMAFALRRAELLPDKVRRVIVVIPFLSIIEQNAKVYRDAMGEDAVLEHRSGVWKTLGRLEDAGNLKAALSGVMNRSGRGAAGEALKLDRAAVVE